MYYWSFKNILYLGSHVKTSAASDLFLLSLLFDVGIVFKNEIHFIHSFFQIMVQTYTELNFAQNILKKKKKKNRRSSMGDKR